MASSLLRTAKDIYELYSQNETSGVRETRKETSALGSTVNDNNLNLGSDCLEDNESVRDYNCDSTENDDYRQSSTEASLGSRGGPYRARQTDKNLTTGLHDVFGRIRKKRCKVLIIAILVFSVLSIVAIITAVMLSKASSAPADVIGTYKLAATATNIEFTEDMLDPYSESFQTISRDFCEEIDKSHSDDFGYAGCIVTGLQNGSVIIQFTIEINESVGRKATNTDTIFTFLGMKPNDGTPNTTFGKFSIGNTEVLQQFTPLGEDSTVPTKVPFNGACGNTNTQRCKTQRSICKNSVCACASDKIYVEDGDSCNSRIYFDKKSGTGIVGENYTMTCIVDNIQGLQGIVITKEDGTDIINDDKVFTVTSDINNTTANLTIEKTIKCGDDGMYYCKPIGTSVDAQAETWISVIWNSGQPIVNLSPDIVEDSLPWGGFETFCTGEIGYNNASIYFQTNKNGAFENLTETESVVIDYTPSNCSNVKKISFPHKYTADWNGTTFRCVVQDSDRMLMDTEIIKVVPVSICHNKPIGEPIPNPFDCRSRFTCSSNAKKLIPYRYCHEADTCYVGSDCVPCETLDKCREDPSDIVPYMECTTTVATIGQLAYINCSLHHTTIEQPNATDVSLLQNGTLIIQTDTPTGTDPYTATYEPQGGDTTRTLVVRSTTIDIVFDPVSCVHKGEYLLRYDNGTSTIEDTELFVVQRTASATNLSKSTDKYYRGVETILSCIGPIGQPEGSLELMYRRNPSDDYELLSDSTSAMSTYDPENCTYIGELHYTFVVRDDLDGYEYRCKSVGPDSQEFYSNTETIYVETSAINFEDEQVTAENGTKFEAKCMISKADGVSGATITLTSNGTANELCTVDSTFTNETVTSQPGYTAFILDDSDHWSLVVSGTAACHHEGTLHCFSPSVSQIKSSSELVITRPSTIPAITVPVAFAGRLVPPNEFSCTADVGYPSLDRVLKMQKKAASEISFVDDFEGEASGICEISEAIATKSNFKFELADNGTEYKCVVYDTKEGTLVTESGIEILRVFPSNCPTDTAESVYLPYPLDCFHRLWCYNFGSLAIQPCPSASCFNATSTECDIPNCTSCPP